MQIKFPLSLLVVTILAPAPRTRHHPATTENIRDRVLDCAAVLALDCLESARPLQQYLLPLRSSSSTGKATAAIKDAKLPLNPTSPASHGQKTRNTAFLIPVRQISIFKQPQAWSYIAKFQSCLISFFVSTNLVLDAAGLEH